MRVDLYFLGDSPVPSTPWAFGNVVLVRPTLEHVAVAMRDAARADADAALFWDLALGPAPADITWLSEHRAEVVHAGLALGTSGSPAILDYIQPTWMWNNEAPPDRESTSWRMTLRACFIRREVIAQLGAIRPEFETLEAAALELGHRYLRRGAFVRHDPRLVPANAATVGRADLPLADELLFARLSYGDFWARWALVKGTVAGDYNAGEVLRSLHAFDVQVQAHREPTFERAEVVVTTPPARVSVIIPTIERYPYLRTLLPQLAAQTVAAHEIFIIDQTPASDRDASLAADFPALPLRIITQDEPGQCTARNHAIRVSSGDYVLFLDDDDEVQPDLIEKHLYCLTRHRADVACGVSEEVGAGPVPENQRFVRASDVLSTNNTMIRRDALRASGLFDLAFDRKQCEDFELGLRLYLKGALAVLDPAMTVLHHHAPRGGLRIHGTRVVTRASSRARINDRNLPHMSEIYLAMRYFNERQVREMLSLRLWGTLRGKGSMLQQGLKAGYGLALLPKTLRAIRAAKRQGEALLREFPSIEMLG